MMYSILILVGLIAGFLSGSVGFGGGMILLPVITYFYGVANTAARMSKRPISCSIGK